MCFLEEVAVGVVMANNTKFVKDGFVFRVLGGCPSCHVVYLSYLACTKGLSALTPIVSGPGFHFMGRDVASHRTICGLFRRRRPSVIMGFTTRDRISHSVRGPRIFLAAGVVNATILVSTYHGCNVGHCRRMSASRICKSLPLSEPSLFFARRAPVRADDPCDSSGTSTSLLILTCREACKLPMAVDHYSGGCKPCRFPRGLVPLVVTGTLGGGPLPMCKANRGIHS